MLSLMYDKEKDSFFPAGLLDIVRESPSGVFFWDSLFK